MAHLDGRWQAAKVGTVLGRRLDAQAEEPTLGAVLARRDVGILSSAEERASRLPQGLREAGGERSPSGAMGGEDAPWIGKVADAYVPGGRQTLDYDHLREHLHAFATCQDPNNPAGAKAWASSNSGRFSRTASGPCWGHPSGGGPGKTPSARRWPS
jgi:hypothetical protein